MTARKIRIAKMVVESGNHFWDSKVTHRKKEHWAYLLFQGTSNNSRAVGALQRLKMKGPFVQRLRIQIRIFSKSEDKKSI